MAYETGIAESELDLLDKLNIFLTSNNELVQNGQAWTVLHDFTLPARTTQKAIRQIAWKSTGTGTGEAIYIAASSDNLIADDTFNLNFWGGAFFNADLIKLNGIKEGLINCSPGVALFADNRPFEYHFIASGRCIKIVTLISQVCSSAYLGFILPTVEPLEYPYPLCVAGSAPIVNDGNRSVRVRYSDITNFHSSIVNARYGNCWLMTPDQSWRDFYGESRVNLNGDSTYQYLFPLANYRLYNSAFFSVTDLMGNAQQGGYPLVPVEFVSGKDSSQGGNRWGVLDGVYWLPGQQRATGDKVTITDNRKGIVFNSGVNVKVRDFFVIETE